MKLTFAGVYCDEQIYNNSNIPIYRIYSKKNFELLLQNRTMYLNNVTSWDDPWEIPCRMVNSLGECDIQGFGERMDKNKLLKEIEYFASYYKKEVFATCFTKNYNTDAMWKIYSHDKDSICVQTSADRLMKSLILNSYTRLWGLLAPVEYLDLNDFEKIFSAELLKKYSIPFHFAFIKRTAFSHEAEIRFAVTQWDYLVKGAIQIPIDINIFIDKIILDPRIDNNAEKDFKQKYKFLNKNISKSDLYADTNIHIENSEKLWGNIKNALSQREFHDNNIHTLFLNRDKKCWFHRSELSAFKNIKGYLTAEEIKKMEQEDKKEVNDGEN